LGRGEEKWSLLSGEGAEGEKNREKEKITSGKKTVTCLGEQAKKDIVIWIRKKGWRRDCSREGGSSRKGGGGANSIRKQGEGGGGGKGKTGKLYAWRPQKRKSRTHRRRALLNEERKGARTIQRG